MLIKSYFAPSVQAAIALAHKEFGHGVTLITSHVASLENRHLGEYEVVFAIEEEDGDIEEPEAELIVAPTPMAEVVTPPALEPTPPRFQEMLQEAILAPSPIEQDLPAKLEQIRTSLVALGIGAVLVRAFMTLLEAALPAQTQRPVTATPPADPVPPVVAAPAAPQPPPLRKPSIPEVKQQRRISKPVAPPAPPPEPAKPAPVPFLSLFAAAPNPKSKPQTRFSAAELAFMSSVTAPKEDQE
jgi:hypothetical protein